MAVQKSHRSKSKKTLRNIKTKILKKLTTTNIYLLNRSKSLKYTNKVGIFKNTTNNLIK